jgi:hypothetical protein
MSRLSSLLKKKKEKKKKKQNKTKRQQHQCKPLFVIILLISYIGGGGALTFFADDFGVGIVAAAFFLLGVGVVDVAAPRRTAELGADFFPPRISLHKHHQTVSTN